MNPKVATLINNELLYQDQKWPGHQHSVAEWILIMQSCLDKAKTAWCGNGGNKTFCKCKLRGKATRGPATTEVKQ